MNISLEQLTQILATTRIYSSQEEHILTAVKSLTIHPKLKEESTFKELCISNEEQLCKQEIEEDEEDIPGDLNQNVNQDYESFIEQWFQASTRLDQCFCFYFVKSHIQQLILHILVYFHFSFANLKMNIVLLLLCEWLNWKYAYT